MIAAVARLGDPSSHGGQIVSAAETVFANGIAVARDGDLHACPIPGHGVTMLTGSGQATIEGGSVVRVGDTAACGAVIIAGSPDTFAG